MKIVDIYPLSSTQQGMLFHAVYAPESSVFVSQRRFTLEGSLDVARFEAAWSEVSARHPILRTAFVWEGLESPLQVVHQEAALPFTYCDLRGLDQRSAEARLEAILDADQRTPFDLLVPPLMRITLVELDGGRLEFVWTNHHLLLDGWSVSAILRDVFECYAASLERRAPRLGSVRPFRDYIAWLESHAANPSSAETFWKQALEGHAGYTKVDLARSNAQIDAASAVAEIEIDPVISETLRQETRARRVTMSSLVHAAWAFVLSRWSGEGDVVFGTTVTGRPSEIEAIESMVGLFLNVLPVRALVAPERTLFDFVGAVQAHLAEGRRFEQTPVLKLREWLGRGPGAPLFESLVVFESAPLAPDVAPNLGVTVQGIHVREDSGYPLALAVEPRMSIALRLSGDPTRFDDESLERMLLHLAEVLEHIAKRPDSRVADLPMLPAGDARALESWNETTSVYPREATLTGWLEAEVRKAPDADAFRLDGSSLSFRDLDRHANRLAKALATAGVKPEDRVAVLVERGFAAPIALYGVLKASAVYMPLDPATPLPRLQSMITDAGVTAIVTTSSTRARGVELDLELTVLTISADDPVSEADDAALPVGTGPDSPAYIIHTSGSTGRPKGVLVPHAQLLNRLAWMWRAYPFEKTDVGCHKTSLTFVDSLWELLGFTLRGLPVVIASEEIGKDPERLIETLEANRVSHFWFVPSLLRAMLDLEPALGRRLGALRLWVSSGEPLPAPLARRFFESGGTRIINLYGTSEVFDATVFDAHAAGGESVPIGRPIDNVRVHVVDEKRRLLPIGVPGELCVSGVGLARGYVSQAANDERFSTLAGRRIYATGDLARHLRDGALEYLGRRDRQLKIAGNRIEPAEVEIALERHPAVHQAAVLAKEIDGEKRLVAWCVAKNGTLPASDALRRDLMRELPSAMIPSLFIEVEKMPLTRSGKIDRLALPMVGPERPKLETAFMPPRTESEEIVARVFQEVLRLESPGVHDGFFDLGGNSLSAMRATHQIREATGVALSLRTVFAEPTIAAIARAIDEEKEKGGGLVDLTKLLERAEQMTDDEVERLLARP